jgi:hypothetical protein
MRYSRRTLPLILQLIIGRARVSIPPCGVFPVVRLAPRARAWSVVDVSRMPGTNILSHKYKLGNG